MHGEVKLGPNEALQYMARLSCRRIFDINPSVFGKGVLAKKVLKLDSMDTMHLAKQQWQ